MKNSPWFDQPNKLCTISLNKIGKKFITEQMETKINSTKTHKKVKFAKNRCRTLSLSSFKQTTLDLANLTQLARRTIGLDTTLTIFMLTLESWCIPVMG